MTTNAPRLTRRDFTAGLGGIVLSFSLGPELALAHPSRGIVHRQLGEGRATGDADRLFQLVDNLVSNAVAYGSATSAITVTSKIAPGEFSIAVHNHGPAIPATVLPTLFQPMVRGTDIASVNRSVGLGLFIVSEIAKAHGGKRELASSDHEGTTFRVRLPRS